MSLVDWELKPEVGMLILSSKCAPKAIYRRTGGFVT